ncbi:MAG: hypothetical protein QF437_09285 [Planctomycetota bacterium]|nr:hypothetical protein [Planctomycetota bacterium]MDP7130670.1 hypothetical protein [Planctomycetota bacterium]MDP7248349.1 hypothetical protein [Planctomycetota bacterium]
MSFVPESDIRAEVETVQQAEAVSLQPRGKEVVSVDLEDAPVQRGRGLYSQAADDGGAQRAAGEFHITEKTWISSSGFYLFQEEIEAALRAAVVGRAPCFIAIEALLPADPILELDFVEVVRTSIDL